MPSIFFLFDRQMSKSEWKRKMNEAVHGHIEAMWQADVTEIIPEICKSNFLKSRESTLCLVYSQKLLNIVKELKV